MSACIYYQPEAYTTSGPRLMGRNAAGESFLRGFIKYSQSNEFWVQVEKTEHAQHFARTILELGRQESVKAVDKTNLQALIHPGVAYYPAPGIGESAWKRAFFGHQSWSLCGITHTTSSAGAMSAISDLITAPVQPWDAVICTSSAVKDNVGRILQAQNEYLEERVGATRIVLPQLPVIPLGIHSDDFAFTSNQKQQARQQLGVDSETLVVLFMGRLSFHAKAHPLAMYQALEKAVIQSGKKVVLIECGWHANEAIATSYIEAARLACPSVQVVTLDGRNTEDRQKAWASADVFCSLSDNIQETFGIVPIEAMAAGLPVVVSDWDGYKDTVRDGIDGFRVATIMPQAGLGEDLAMRHALEIDTYDRYCGQTCTLVAVDIEAATQAFVMLFESKNLRAKMGCAGQQRAREIYDWRSIIPQYEALWAQQTELRKSVGGQFEKPRHPWPARMDPFFSFGNYPTQHLSPETWLVLYEADVDMTLGRLKSYQRLLMVNFAKQVLPTDMEIMTILQSAIVPRSAIDLLSKIDEGRRPFVFRSLNWMLKMGALRIASQNMQTIEPN